MTHEVLVLCDAPLVRYGLCCLLREEVDFRVRAHPLPPPVPADSLAEADLVLLDLCTLGRDGLGTVERVRASAPDAPIVVFVMQADPPFLEAVRDAGGRVCFDGLVEPEAILETARRLLDGEEGSAAGRRTKTQVVGPLSDREWEVLRYTGEGFRPSEIADRLYISAKTVHRHRENLQAKLGLSSGPDLDRFAIRWLFGGAVEGGSDEG